MTTRYLLHFAHEHLSFRWPEFLAQTSKNDCEFKLSSKIEHLHDRPFIILEVQDKLNEERLIQSARGCYLLKHLYELWGSSVTSLEDLSEEVSQCHQVLSGSFATVANPYRVDCESFGSKLAQSTKVDYISRMKFLATFQVRPNLKNPAQRYCIFVMNEKHSNGVDLKKEYYFGRQIASGDRSVIKEFTLKERIFIANTTMDPMLSLIAISTAKVKKNDIVYDPFVGSGSFLVAAAYTGAYVFGSDIDWLLLHGKSRPSRKGEKVRREGESVRLNLHQYNLQDRYLDVMISDVTRSPLSDHFVVDAIVSDPPYGIRECSERIGVRGEYKPKGHCKVRYPSKTSYKMQDLFADLLKLSAKHLTVGGRLVYFLPVTKCDRNLEEYIPLHSCLKLISYSEQELTAKTSRLMVVMEKTRRLDISDRVYVPQSIHDMNFREAYFSKSLEDN